MKQKIHAATLQLIFLDFCRNRYAVKKSKFGDEFDSLESLLQ